MKNGILIGAFLMLLTLIVIGASSWTTQGSWSTPATGTYKFSFSGIIDGISDTLTSNSFTPKGFEPVYKLWFKADQTNDSCNIQILKQGYSLGRWQNIRIIGADTISNNTITGWVDSLAGFYQSYRYLLYGVNTSGGDKNGYRTSFSGEAIFKNETATGK